MQTFRIECALLQRSQRRLVGDEHVRRREQSLEDLGVAAIIVIQGDGPLVAIGGQEIGGLAADERRTPAAGLVSSARALDLDDVGAEIAKEHGAVGPGKGLGKFNDANGIEYGFHGRIIAKMSAVVRTRRDFRRLFALSRSTPLTSNLLTTSTYML
jgi:hypothetical protein